MHMWIDELRHVGWFTMFCWIPSLQSPVVRLSFVPFEATALIPLVYVDLALSPALVGGLSTANAIVPRLYWNLQNSSSNYSEFIYIYIPIGSMVLVYMLTWLGYIDGKCYHIYIIHGSYGICIYIYIHIYIYTHIYIYIYIYIHIHTYIHIYIHTYIYIYISMSCNITTIKP